MLTERLDGSEELQAIAAPMAEKKHVIANFLEARQAGTGPQTMVIGHRGGFIGGPENSMPCFKAALANRLDGIEFDVWLSKDDVPMIVHGGDNGELHDEGNNFIFDLTQEQLQSQIDIGEGQRIPTLEQLLQECEGSEMLLNIEMKAPNDVAISARYDHRLAAEIVCNLISKYRIAHQTMISSFNPKVISAVNSASEGRRDFIIQSLRNFDLRPDPANYEISADQQCDGIHIVYSQLTRSLVQRIKQTNEQQNSQPPLLGVWYFAEESSENQTMYSRVFHTAGTVDFFYSDKPLQAIQARDAIRIWQRGVHNDLGV